MTMVIGAHWFRSWLLFEESRARYRREIEKQRPSWERVGLGLISFDAVLRLVRIFEEEDGGDGGSGGGGLLSGA